MNGPGARKPLAPEATREGRCRTPDARRRRVVGRLRREAGNSARRHHGEIGRRLHEPRCEHQRGEQSGGRNGGGCCAVAARRSRVSPRPAAGTRQGTLPCSICDIVSSTVAKQPHGSSTPGRRPHSMRPCSACGPNRKPGDDEARRRAQNRQSGGSRAARSSSGLGISGSAQTKPNATVVMASQQPQPRAGEPSEAAVTTAR